MPSDASTMTLPMRPWFPSKTGAIIVSVTVDDRWLANIELRALEGLGVVHAAAPATEDARRHRRVDLHVSRMVPPFNLGIELGVVQFR